MVSEYRIRTVFCIYPAYNLRKPVRVIECIIIVVKYISCIYYHIGI